MIADRPVLGLGVGRYYEESALFLSPEMAWTYAFQNAHNYFLQVAAEIGLVGVSLLLAVLGSRRFQSDAGNLAQSGRPAPARMRGRCRRDADHVADRASAAPRPKWRSPSGSSSVCSPGSSGSVLIATGELPRKPAAGCRHRAGRAASWSSRSSRSGRSASAAVRSSLRSSASVSGLEPWESDADGTRFRWTHEYASLFVPANATRVYIPVRLPVDVPRLLPMPVDVEVGGVYRGRTLVGTTGRS